MTVPEPLDLAAASAGFTETYPPRVAAEWVGQMVELARIQGRFVMHARPNEGELFFVQRGELLMHFEAGPTHTVRGGELLLVPATTLKTGDVGGGRTRDAVPLGARA